MLGRAVDEILGKSDAEIFDPTDALRSRGVDSEVIERGQPICYQAAASSAGGVRRVYETTKSPLRDAGGAVVGVIGVSRDITEYADLYEREQQARRDAEAANRLKDEFLAVVSHELRTPLAPILMWASLLRAGGADEPTRARALERIDAAARHQARLIDDLLDLSRVQSGKLRLERVAVDVRALVEAVVEGAGRRASERGVRIELQPLPPATLHVDAERLQQVIGNLVDNAIKFSPPGGTVRVGGRCDAGDLVIRVVDDGVGVAPEDLPHLFDRFWQADLSLRRRSGGLGLGLTIVKHLVELHGGSVSVQSAGRDRGASFEVRLPLHDQRAAAPPPASAPDLRLDGIRVLVVDDDVATLEAMGASLRVRGAEVIALSSPAEVLPALAREQVAILVSDLAMPGEDGFSLLRRVRALAPSLPAIAVSALVRDQERAAAVAAGFDAHLGKPVDAPTLLRTIATLLRR